MSKGQSFINKIERIRKAINRVDLKLNFFIVESRKIEGNWTEQDQEKFKDWNLWHDLHDRLLDRLNDAIDDYYDWHWNEFGFNSYIIF